MGPVADETTIPTPAVSDEMVEAAARVLADVEGWDYDALGSRELYIARAELALSAALDGHMVVREDDYTRLIQYRRDTLGLICPRGHHTRFVDVLGDPNDKGYVCAHCAVRSFRESPSDGDREALLPVLDPHVDAADMAPWERRDRLSKAEHQARRVLAAGYRLATEPTSGPGFKLADRFGGRPR